MDLQRFESKCRKLQWSVDDLDWEAPGAEVLGARAPATSELLSILYWIELTASQVFGCMAERSSDPLERAVFESFVADEARHADAQRRLMVRWGLLKPGQRPVALPCVRNLRDGMDRVAHRISPSIMSAMLPLVELALDGALIKHIERSVEDPIGKAAFARLNADEARHLAMDFHMLRKHGREDKPTDAIIDLIKTAASPRVLFTMIFGYVPVLKQARVSAIATGLAPTELDAAVNRFRQLGQRYPDAARHPTYRILCAWIDQVRRSGRNRLGDVMLHLSDRFGG